jgi:hypothetical protein
MREAIHRLATATAFRLKAEATLTMRGDLEPDGGGCYNHETFRG